jgi:rhodanese-related sulfurtransferase
MADASHPQSYAGPQIYAGDLAPAEAWRRLSCETSSRLVDVRTQAEWMYVGLPDLSALGKQPLLVAWQIFPSMQRNTAFVPQLESLGVRTEETLLFLCRSGVRSRAAAEVMAGLGYRCCYNILDGFEGPPDERRQRGRRSGWKAAGLPWIPT